MLNLKAFLYLINNWEDLDFYKGGIVLKYKLSIENKKIQNA